MLSQFVTMHQEGRSRTQPFLHDTQGNTDTHTHTLTEDEKRSCRLAASGRTLRGFYPAIPLFERNVAVALRVKSNT